MNASHNKKEIFLFYKSLVNAGGAERLLIEEYKAFRKLGYNTTIVTFSYNLRASFDENLGKNIVVLGSKGWLVAFLRLLFLFIKNKNTKIIVASGIIEIYLATLLSRNSYSIHYHHPTTMDLNTNKFSFSFRNKFQYILNRTYEKELLTKYKKKIGYMNYLYISLREIFSYLSIKKAKHVFVLSDYAKEEFRYLYNVDCFVVQGAVPEASLDHLNSEPLKTQKKSIKFLSISRLEPQKRIDKAIMALSKLQKKLPEFKFHIGGKGSQEEELKLLVSRLGMEKNVEFLGFVHDSKLSYYYANSDLFISLDWADFNITAFEALSLRTKILTSDEGEIDERLIELGYVFRSDPRNENDILCNINNFLNVTKNIDNLKLKKILEEYTWEKYCKKIINIMNSH